MQREAQTAMGGGGSNKGGGDSGVQVIRKVALLDIFYLLE
jgi:hypothetical protein